MRVKERRLPAEASYQRLAGISLGKGWGVYVREL